MGDFVCPHARDFSCAKQVVGWRCSVAQSRDREFKGSCAKEGFSVETDAAIKPTAVLSC